MEHLFVYGSLRRGTEQSSALRRGVGNEYARFLEMNGTYIGPGTAEGRLIMLSKYPGFVDGKGKVLGDLYQVNTVTLKKLDTHEGFEFERLKREVVGPDGPVDAWIYVYKFSPTGKPRIESGDWSTYVPAKSSDSPEDSAGS